MLCACAGSYEGITMMDVSILGGNPPGPVVGK